MTALPINPTYVDLYDTYANAYTNATEEQLASELHDGDRHSVAKLAVFQAGVEAERARAAAETTGECGKVAGFSWLVGPCKRRSRHEGYHADINGSKW